MEFADICGSTFDANSNSVATYKTQFQFTVTVYKSLDTTKSDETRIIYSSNIILGQSATTTMGNTCYSAISTGKSSTTIADTINIAGATSVLRTTESSNGTLPVVNADEWFYKVFFFEEY